MPLSGGDGKRFGSLIRFSISWQLTSIGFLLWVKLPLSILDRSKPKKQAAPVPQFVSLTDVDSEVLTNSPKWRTILTIRLRPLMVLSSNPVSHAFRQLPCFRWWYVRETGFRRMSILFGTPCFPCLYPGPLGFAYHVLLLPFLLFLGRYRYVPRSGQR